MFSTCQEKVIRFSVPGSRFRDVMANDDAELPAFERRTLELMNPFLYKIFLLFYRFTIYYQYSCSQNQIFAKGAS
jgi:hypothetical protein